jgi:hypothetical protein
VVQAAKDVKFRFIWDFPIHISPHDNNTVYVGSQFVHKTTTGGQRWDVISPDLTLNDKSKQVQSGGIWPDNIGVEYGDVVYAIAESPVTRGLIWAGTNDGLVHLTRDGGRTWTNVTRNIPGMIAWGTVSNIEPSRFNAGTAFLTVNGHQEGNFDPWVYRTRDYGQTWQLIVNGIPKTPLSFARIVREDPVRRGLLYLGTENALYVSWNDGDAWEPLQLDLPPAPVSWMTIQRTFNDLVVSTVRARVLHPGRHHAAAAVDRRGAGVGVASLCASSGISVPADRQRDPRALGGSLSWSQPRRTARPSTTGLVRFPPKTWPSSSLIQRADRSVHCRVPRSAASIA